MSITVIYGPMFSSKTTTLMERIRYLNKKSIPHMIFKPQIDVRYSTDSIVSHAGDIISENVYVVSVDALKIDLIDIYSTETHIFIDEGHMFKDNLVKFAFDARDKGHNVVVAGLLLVFDGSSFKNMKELIENSDSTVYCQGVCAEDGCCEKSKYTHLKNIEGVERKSILVGGAELYEPLCEEHYILKNN